MPPTRVLWSQCRNCRRSTRHEVLDEHIDDGDPNAYRERTFWQIVRCLGCFSFGFRREHADYEMVTFGLSNEPEMETTVHCYPQYLRDHVGIDAVNYLPKSLRIVYTQTVRALADGSTVLAGIGLRACIEALCNHLNVAGRNLEKRIDQLFKAGLVSSQDRRRLHAIRFLGNDAAHEIVVPSSDDLRTALDIVEHTLNSVFVLEQRSRDLEIACDTYSDFTALLAKCALAHKSEGSISLASLLGKRRRLVGEKFEEFERSVIKDVKSGHLAFLVLDEMATIEGLQVQLYKVDCSKIGYQDDDIPF
jgi:hypothetical protein